MTITTDNYEEYFYRYCEGEMTTEERAEVEAFAAQHPDLAEELSLYDPALKLEENPMTYPDKEGLMRHEAMVVPFFLHTPRLHRTPLKRGWAVAACVAAVMIGGVWLLWPDGGQVEQETMVAELHQDSLKTETVETTQQLPSDALPAMTVAPVIAPVSQEKTAAPIKDEPIEQLPQYEPHTTDEPLLLADAEPVPVPQQEDTTVIEYIDIIVFPTYQSQVEVVAVAYQPTVGDRFRAFRSRVSNTVRDYAYQSYSEARGEILTRINY